MHIAFVADYMPSPSTSGAGLHLWSLVNQAVREGHRVSYVLVGRPHEFQILPPPAVGRMVDALLALGVELIRRDFTGTDAPPAGMGPSRAARIGGRLRRALLPRLRDFDAELEVPAIRARVESVMRDLEPDAVFAFNDGPIAAVRALDGVRRVAWPADPIHLLYESRWRHRAATGKARALLLYQRLSYRPYPRWITQQLAGYDAVVHQAAHHARWFRERGIANCLYIPSPIADPLGADVDGSVARIRSSNRLKILHLGHLGGAASMTGLPMFLNETLPVLESALGPQGFEVHFVGRIDVSDEIRDRMRHDSIRLRGFVEDLTEEILSSDVFLVPIPHEVGSRTRLLTALAYGSCAVAHDSCRLGNPELLHDENVLLASTGVGLASEILRAWRDPELRARLRRAARETYLRHYSLQTAGDRWLSAITGTAVAAETFDGSGVGPSV
jgi:glycosyltransferase involved in cell wall biosynthesis